jgi:hypothetical protein
LPKTDSYLPPAIVHHTMIFKLSQTRSDRYPPLSMAVQNKKVSNDIPADLAFSIMSKWFPKSLNRFKCVRKSWSPLFENPYFMSLFQNNFLSNNSSSYDDTSILLHTNITIDSDHKQVLYSLSGERYGLGKYNGVLFSYLSLEREDNTCLSSESTVTFICRRIDV